MIVISRLLAAIEADPHDESAQLVIADHLQGQGDPRGDLIVLDYAERRGLLDDAEALERLLLLAADYSFPHAGPDAPNLFERDDGARFVALHQGLLYELFFNDRQRWELRISGNDRSIVDHWLPLNLGAEWTPDEERVVLTITSDAIHARTPMDDLRFPYGVMPLPQHEGSPLRCYTLPTEFTIPREILRNRYGLAARDYHRWHAIWQRLRVMQRR